MYCKKKNGNNYNQNSYYNYMVMPAASKLQNATSLPTLHPLAPVFKPKGEQIKETVTTNVKTKETPNSANLTSVSKETIELPTENTLQTIEEIEQQPQQPQQEQQPNQQQLQQHESDPSTALVPFRTSVDEEEIEEIEEAEVFCPDYGGRLPQIGHHPLQCVWTFWYLETDRSKTWEEMQNEIISFDNVEDFWRLYNHIKPASEIKVGSDYSLFRNGIRPMWEDEGNRNGGRWIITLPRFCPKFDLDSIWLDTLLSIIGETFEHSSQICGAVVNIRSKQSKVSVWTSDGSNDRAIVSIGYQLKSVLLLDNHPLQYQLHMDTMSRNTASIAPKYVI